MPNLQKTDQQIWDQFRSGDDDAYSFIYEEYAEKMFSYGIQFSSDRELIKDCVQDVFVKLYTNRHKLNATRNIKFYLFVVLKNNLYNHFRKTVIFNPIIPDIDISDIEISPELQLLNKEEDFLQKERLQKLLDLLSPRQQEVLYYRFIEELSFEEIEELMQINYQSIQNLIHRSFKKIRENAPSFFPLFVFFYFSR